MTNIEKNKLQSFNLQVIKYTNRFAGSNPVLSAGKGTDSKLRRQSLLMGILFSPQI